MFGSSSHSLPGNSSYARPAHSRLSDLLLTACAGVAFLPSAMMQAQKPAAAPAVTVPGSLQVHVSNWTVPGKDVSPSGVFSKRDGTVWYAAEAGDELGHFDPKTQKFEEVHLRPGTHPNAMVEHSGSGVQTTLYFTSRDGGYVGEFDPNTRDVREFRLTGGKARLQRLVFDRNGVVWFTVGKAQSPQFPTGAKVAFLNLFSSEIEFAAIPTPGADPFDLEANSKGTIFFTERGSPRLGSVEPDSLKVTEYPLPNPKIGTNSLAIAPDDAVWYTDSARGYIGRFEPTTKKFQEWPSPSGPHSRPGDIAMVDGVVWYVESGSEPNALVRFDPGSDKFQSWPLAEGGDVGQMYAQPDGTLWLTRPQSNAISEVVVDKKN